MQLGQIIQTPKLPLGRVANTGHLNAMGKRVDDVRPLMNHGQGERLHFKGATVWVRPISVIATGKYKVNVFMPPARTDLKTAITPSQLGEESTSAYGVAWNGSEASGGTALIFGVDAPPVVAKVLNVDADGTVNMIVLGSPGGGITPVRLVKDVGGLNGGISAGVPFYSTFTYSIYAMSDDPDDPETEPLATGLTPQENRPIGPIIHSGGKIGDAIFFDGSWMLIRASEQLDLGPCAPEE